MNVNKDSWLHLENRPTLYETIFNEGSPELTCSSCSNWTYRPRKRAEVAMASNGMTKVPESLFIAQSRSTKLKRVNGININPNKVNHHILEGLISMETYEKTRRPATMSISTREVIPRKPFFFVFLPFIPRTCYKVCV